MEPLIPRLGTCGETCANKETRFVEPDNKIAIRDCELVTPTPVVDGLYGDVAGNWPSVTYESRKSG